MKKFFVTGTDTGVGKTTVSCALLAAARAQGLRTLAVKPVAAGCVQTPEGLRNDDALALMGVMTEVMTYEEVNPVALPEPLSPHLAALHAGRRLSIAQIGGFVRGALMRRVDFAVVEGAGGWRVPISDREILSDLPRALGLPVILVVGLRLGCLNHAILTTEAMARDGVRLAGWVGNVLDPDMAALDGNVGTLKTILPMPCLGVIPWQPGATPEALAAHLDLHLLLGGIG
ncbi:MAG: dethiobiotin synthase [Moraxellaceae bacterium]|jgi:dethiobiotin synthetase|nr:dethiobiotin synthase [Moraxellaceae bacterium]